MKKIILIAFGFLSLSSLTGCIDFLEQLVVNENGGGHFLRKLDMSEMMEMGKMIAETVKDSSSTKKEDEGPSDQEKANDMAKSLLEDAEAIKKVSGISNVKVTQDSVNSIYTLEFDFNNDDALNNALNESGSKKPKADKFYTISKSSVSRSEHNSLDDLTRGNDNKETVEMMQAILGEMKYNLEVTVPTTIKNVSNKDAVTSEDKKKVTLKTTMKDLVEKKVSNELKITY